MRLWSLHPRYLDTRGLVALWREALLARAVLRDLTIGYRRHPQLARFVEHPTPRRAISVYLNAIYYEAAARGYEFDSSKIGPVCVVEPIIVTRGQLEYEWEHLLGKLSIRDPERYQRWRLLRRPECHPLMNCTRGPIASWEKARSQIK